jgi:hypothetical protein
MLYSLSTKVNYRLLISISLSLVIHLIILGLLKLTENKSEQFNSNQNSISFNIFLKKTVSEINNKGVSELATSYNDEMVENKAILNDLAKKIRAPAQPENIIPEPKYYTIKELDHPPKMTSEIDTRPEELAQYNEGGEIKVQIWIDEEGNVIKSETVNSNLPQAFIDYTLESFNQAKFLPGIKDGVPVRAIAKVVVQYAAIE